MISVDITVPQVIILGRSGEYGLDDAVEFDITTYTRTLGEGTPTLYFRRTSGEAAYIPLNVSFSEGIVTWIPSETDLGVRTDSGYVEIRYEYDGGRVVSKGYRVIVKESITDDVIGDVSLGEQYLAEIAAYMQPILENHIIYSDFVDSMDTYKEDYPFAFSVNGYTGDVTLTYSDVSALPDSTFIPTAVSDLENDLGFLTEHQDISGKANVSDLAAVATSGDYDDLTNTPQNVSEFDNDAGYLTQHQDISGKADASNVYTKSETDELLNEFVSEYIVTVTMYYNTYTADKTYAELLEASQNKKIVCMYDNKKLQMIDTDDDTFVFQGISMDSGVLTSVSMVINSSDHVDCTIEYLDEAVKSVNGKEGNVVLEYTDVGIYRGTTAEIQALIHNHTIEDGDLIILTDDDADDSDAVDYVLRTEFNTAMNNKATVVGTPSDGQFLVYSSSRNAYVPATITTADNIVYGGTT